MPIYIAGGNGNASSATLWQVVDQTSVSYLNVESDNAVLTTAYVESAATTPGAITIDGIAVKVARRVAVPSGTISVRLAQGGALVAGTEVTLNVSDIPYGVGIAANTNHNGWIFFKFAAPVLLVVATAYTVSAKTSVAAQVHLYRNATAGNWSRMLRTTTQAAIVAADEFHILGEFTAAATFTARAVTWDITAATDFGAASTTIAGVSIGTGGTMTWGTAAATAYLMRLSAIFDVCTGGTLNMGTTGTPCPRDSSMTIEFDCAADGDFGLRVFGTWIAQGQSRLAGSTHHFALLNTDEAAAQTVLGLDRQLSAASGDAVALGSTTKTVTQSEDRILSGDAGASSITVTVGLTNAHLGTAPVQGIVVGLTRAVRVISVSSTFMTYVNFQTGASVDLDWVEFRYCGSSAAGGSKQGVTWVGSSGSVNINKCVSRDSDHSGFVNDLTAGIGEFTITDCVVYRFAVGTSAQGFYVAQATANVWTITGCVAIGFNTSSTGFWCADLGGTFTDNWASSCQNAFRIGELTAVIAGKLSGTFARLTAQSSNSAGFLLEQMQGGTFSDLVAWRNGSNAINFSVAAITDVTFDGGTFFGCGSAQIQLTAGNTNITFRGVNSNGDTAFAVQNGLVFPAGFSGRVRLESCNFGVVGTGLVTHSTTDISIGTQGTQPEITLVNTVLASATEITGASSITGRGFIAYQKDEGVSGDNRIHYPALGTISYDAVTFRTAPASEKIEPTAAYSAFRLETITKGVPVASGQSCTISCYVNKGGTYNGSAPRLRVRENVAAGVAEATVATHASAAGSFVLTLRDSRASQRGLRAQVLRGRRRLGGPGERRRFLLRGRVGRGGVMDEPLMVNTKRGFAAGDNAAAAARKNHELGTAHRFTPKTASAAGRRGLEKRWSSRSSALTASHCPATPDGVLDDPERLKN